MPTVPMTYPKAAASWAPLSATQNLHPFSKIGSGPLIHTGDHGLHHQVHQGCPPLQSHPTRQQQQHMQDMQEQIK